MFLSSCHELTLDGQIKKEWVELEIEGTFLKVGLEGLRSKAGLTLNMSTTLA